MLLIAGVIFLVFGIIYNTTGFLITSLVMGAVGVIFHIIINNKDKENITVSLDRLLYTTLLILSIVFLCI